MTAMSLSVAAKAVDGSVRGADVSFCVVSTDTRRLQPGDLYVALHGERFDGHAFVAEAQRKGAIAALVSESLSVDLPQLRVADTRLGLGRLAQAWRAHFNLPVVGVTGSNGKTTVKEMIARILENHSSHAPSFAQAGTAEREGRSHRKEGGDEHGAVLVTQGNLNNDIGVPLTLLRLQSSHRYAVIEMGANHGGEIAYLTELTHPSVGVVTNAGAAHIEGFGTLDGVAHGKGEIFAGLAPDGVAVLNADDHYAEYWRGVIGTRRTISFGMQHPADVSAVPTSVRVELGEQLRTTFTLLAPSGTVEIALPLCGLHNVMNALCAAAVALAVGVELPDIRRGLEAMVPVQGRLQLKCGRGALRVLDDTYNANPASLVAALEVLSQASTPKILVLGDMAELGDDAAAMHAAVAEQARAAGVVRMYAVGGLSRYAVESYGIGARHFDVQASLIEAVQAEWRGDAPAVILVKGSRRMQMEKVVAALTAAADPASEAH